MKQNLNEQIARIKQLLVIKESFVVKETETILNEQFFGKLLQKMGSAFETKFVTSIEGKLGKKIATATDAEIGAALKSLPVLRQEIAAAVYTAEKSMIDGVFSKYDMSIAGDALAAYKELQVNGLNKNIIKDVTSEWKTAGKGGTTTTTGTIAPPSTAGTIPNFNIPNLNTTVLNQAWKMDVAATRAAIKGQFPKASSRDIEIMVQGLEKTKDQASFDIAIKDAVENFKPTYVANLSNPGNMEIIRKRWNLLQGYQKFIIGLAATIIGYRSLKAAGVPVEQLGGWLTGGAKEIANDQFNSTKDELKKGFKNPTLKPKPY